jgi:hypothetical protein
MMRSDTNVDAVPTFIFDDETPLALVQPKARATTLECCPPPPPAIARPRSSRHARMLTAVTPAHER